MKTGFSYHLLRWRYWFCSKFSAFIL